MDLEFIYTVALKEAKACKRLNLPRIRALSTVWSITTIAGKSAFIAATMDMDADNITEYDVDPALAWDATWQAIDEVYDDEEKNNA